MLLINASVYNVGRNGDGISINRSGWDHMKNNIIDKNICVGDYQRKPFVANKQPSKWQEPSNQMSDKTRCPVRVQLPNDIVLQLEESARAFDADQLRKQQQQEKQHQREKQQQEKQQ